ncbi:MAG: TonB dependent receptor [Bacteroidota bacterium]
MRQFFLGVFFFFFFLHYCFANIRGKVYDNQKRPLMGVNILLLDSSASIILKTGISDENGLFEIVISEPGIYRLKINKINFEAFDSSRIIYTEDLVLSDIILHSRPKQLQEVSVTNEKPLIEMKAGKIIMNVEQSISAAGSSVFEMLQRAPNVSIDNNDRIALKGRQGVQIMIDGKLMVIQGTELVNMLKSIPAAALEKIELMSSPGAQYDAAGTAGIINLKTKKEKRQGYNGTATQGLGQGVYTKSNTGLNLNYRKDKVNIFFNGNMALRKGFNKLDLDRIFIKNADYNGSYKQDNYAVIKLQNFGINAGIDYNLSSKTTIGATVSANKTSYTFDGENNGRLYDSSRNYLSYFLSNNHQKNSGSSIALNTNLRHSFDSLGRSLSFDADYAKFVADNNQTQATNYFLPNGEEEKPRYTMDGTLNGYTDIKAVKSDYVHPLKGNTKLEVGFKLSAVVADNRPDFYDVSNGAKIFDSSKSNHFIYHENISAAYFNYNKDWKKWSVQAGVRYEHTRAKGEQISGGQSFDRNYGQLFPNIVGSFTASPKHQFSLSLSRRIDRPNYEQLNPFKNYIDPTSIHQGNPYLNPSFSYTAELSHTYNNRFSTSFSIAQTNDVITQVIILDEDKITLVTDRNLAANRVYSLSGNYPLKLFKWWTSIASANLYYSIYEGNLSNSPLRDGIPTAYLSSNNSFVLHKNWSAEINSWFSSDQRYGYMYLRPMYAINLGIQKQFWNKTGTLRVSATDIFRAQNPTGITEFSNYREFFVVTRDTRTINCSFSYRFGNSKWQRQRREGGADEERRRAGSGTQSS